MSARIRRLNYEDLPPVLEIERQSFTNPWSMAMFMLELSKPSTIALAIVEPAERILGYLVCSRYASIWHVMNVSVDPPVRRKGLATAMIKRLFALTEDREELVQYTLEVRVSNTAAVAMYQHLGFEIVGRRQNYYRDNGEDAVVMWRTVRLGSVVPDADHQGLADQRK